MTARTVRDEVSKMPITMTVHASHDEARCAMFVAADHCRRIDWIVRGERATAALAALKAGDLDRFAETEG